MNRQNFMEHVSNPTNVEQTGQDPDKPVVNSNSYAEAPTDETIVQEAPMGQTIVYNKDSMGETIEHEAPIGETIPDVAPDVETNAHEASAGTNTEFPAPLLDSTESEYLRTRWNEIQGKFVDEPRSAVQQADALVSEVVEKITQMFANEHGSLESQWNQGKDVSTEDLRQTLQHYRAFFNRLVM
jgi:hypothetical protein